MTSTDLPITRNLVALARVGHWVIAVSAVAIVCYGCYLIAVPAEAYAVLSKELPGIQKAPSVHTIIAATLVAAIPVTAFLVALFEAWQFLGEVKKRKPFSSVAQQSLQRLGRAALACAVAGVLARTAVVLILTSSNPPDQKMLVIGFSSGDMASAVVAVLVFVFANIVREAAALRQENEMFI
jgi:hypothetical protein